MVVARFSAQIFVRVHARVMLHRRSQIDEMTREGTAQSVAVPCKKQPKRWKLGSAEMDDKQVPDSQKFCAPDAGVYMRTLGWKKCQYWGTPLSSMPQEF